MQIAKPLIAAALAALCSTAAHAGPDALFRYNGAIGVDPLTAAGGVDVSNTVRGIAPGGRAWVIRRLKAEITADGTVTGKGAGLLLASGDGIATVGAVTHVAATLTCGPAASPGTARKFTTAPSPLDAFGRFSIAGVLREEGSTATAVLPVPCEAPVLLIRNANPTTGVAGGWFAVGTPSSDRDDD